MEKILPEFSMEVTFERKLVYLLSCDLIDNSFFICIDQHVVMPWSLFFLLLWLRLVVRFLLFGSLCFDALEANQIFHYSRVLELFGEMQGSLFVFIDQIVFTASVDKKLAHLQLSISGCVEETCFPVLVQLVDVTAIPDKQLCNFEPTKASSPIKRCLLEFVQVRKVEVEGRQHFFKQSDFSLFGHIGKNGLPVFFLVVRVSSLLEQHTQDLQSSILVVNFDCVEKRCVEVLVRQVHDLFDVVSCKKLPHLHYVSE